MQTQENTQAPSIYKSLILCLHIPFINYLPFFSYELSQKHLLFFFLTAQYVCNVLFC